MITTIYKCDKCGAEQATNEQFWNVGIIATTNNMSWNEVKPKKSIQVCRACLESFGINVTEKNKEKLPTQPTVEELIRQIMEIVS